MCNTRELAMNKGRGMLSGGNVLIYDKTHPHETNVTKDLMQKFHSQRFVLVRTPEEILVWISLSHWRRSEDICDTLALLIGDKILWYWLQKLPHVTTSVAVLVVLMFKSSWNITVSFSRNLSGNMFSFTTHGNLTFWMTPRT